ncbi:phytoene desaturase family protein [Flavobacterium sp. Fl-318]|uniref:Phytoene desaturase family protein n=1 Tax=Flavobacterium cupriresistens TaxID=2893885 RepID=A0ABU4RB97_9FLAO|nr:MULTISPECIES: phytoene desaturase family protein [unclassified Flavobacterium]MDX6189857.1 phytoene desaturase family protein [Flavobacterium sp. Fl-318]UFH42683.1 phytoene desaturase [Flavobacterium sp. F-323]
MKKTIIIIGSGFSALAASCYLAQQGNSVTIYEKNETIGGRARQFKKDGFTFDMGPSWYWMPDVFERFFNDFNKKPSDYYELIKLNPAYRVYFGVEDFISICDNLEAIQTTFETIETGSSKKLAAFIKEAKSNYDIAIKDLVYRPGVSPLELITPQTALKLNQFFSTVSRDVRKNFKNERLIQILEFPVLFLGAKPTKTPSFYNFMNYADFGLGTWHPKTGMFDVVRGIEKLALELGVTIKTNSVIEKIVVTNKITTGVLIDGKHIQADIVLSGADYHHTETLLDKPHRSYSEAYWESRTFAPSSLLFFVGFDKKIENTTHHNLFFDVDFNQHAIDIYDQPKWPEAPLFYANFPSKTDETAAPKGMESAFFLIPLAPGIKDTEALREEYFEKIITRFEQITQQKIKNNIIFKKSFCKNDFVADYNAYKGNAYGMANTLLQTAFLRPKLKSKKVKNLFFTGQLTVPGPGVPPALISGKLVAELIHKSIRS